MSETRDKPINELLTRSMVDIYVGPENTHWVLHEKLLCTRSKFFQKIFYSDGRETASSKTFGLPEEEDSPFRLFVGWLYSENVIPPREEKDLTDLYDLYLMGEKWQIARLVKDVLDAVRSFYRNTQTYPGLRRVQYIYANTDQDSPMRQLLVGSVARMITLGNGIPAHWDKALRKNGQLAVDLMLAIQSWHVPEEDVPDYREEAGESEKKKLETVKKGEEKQEGKAKEIKQEDDQDSKQDDKQDSKEKKQPKKIKQEPKDDDGKPLTNGVHHDDDEDDI